jgi:hypothetical protein
MLIYHLRRRSGRKARSALKQIMMTCLVLENRREEMAVIRVSSSLGKWLSQVRSGSLYILTMDAELLSKILEISAH